MMTSIRRKHENHLHRFISAFIAFTFSWTSILPLGYAQLVPQTLLNLPVPGAMVTPSPAFVPVLLKGITIHPENPLQFDFIVDSGNTDFKEDRIKEESQRLVKYFLASMTIPKDDLWVNLSPYESDKIIPEELGKTELGRDMLAQDYILKQLTASLMYPEKELGKEFWDRVYKKAEEQFGTSEIPVNTFNKVWILPDTATVYEHGQTVYIVEAKLRVMLEQDYVAMNAGVGASLVGARHRAETSPAPTENNISTSIIRAIILPEIEKEVNEGRNFAPLRQIYHSLILAKWYKETIKNSLLSKVYIDQKKIAGVNVDDETLKDQIYAQYMEAYKKGVFNYIKEDYDRLSNEVIPRKYFSGGIDRLTNFSLIKLDKTSNPDRVVSAEVGKQFVLTTKADPQKSGVDRPKKSSSPVNEHDQTVLELHKQILNPDVAISSRARENAAKLSLAQRRELIKLVRDTYNATREKSPLEENQDYYGLGLEDPVKAAAAKEALAYLEGLGSERLLEKLKELGKNSGLPFSTAASFVPAEGSDNAFWTEALRVLRFKRPIYRRVEREGKEEERGTGQPAFNDVGEDTDIKELTDYDVSQPKFYSIRKVEDIRLVLEDPNAEVPPEVYFMHRGVFASKKDIQKAFYENKQRYDITVIPPAIWGIEYAKTAGHFHAPVEKPEIYQIISGEGMWLLQKTDDDGKVVDFITVRAKAGDFAIMLPGYGHVTVNLSETEPLVLANWLTWNQTSFYGSFKAQKGAAYYVIRQPNGEPALMPNSEYKELQKLPLPRQMTTADQISEFGLVRGEPIYNLVKKDDFADKIDFLNNPGNYTAILTPHNTLKAVEQAEQMAVLMARRGSQSNPVVVTNGGNHKRFEDIIDRLALSDFVQREFSDIIEYWRDSPTLLTHPEDGHVLAQLQSNQFFYEDIKDIAVDLLHEINGQSQDYELYGTEGVLRSMILSDEEMTHGFGPNDSSEVVSRLRNFLTIIINRKIVPDHRPKMVYATGIKQSSSPVRRALRDYQYETIATLNEEILEAIAKLEQNIEPARRMPSATLRRFLNTSDRTVIVARDPATKEIIGYIFGLPQQAVPETRGASMAQLQGTFYEMSWQVLPQYQGKGIGSALRYLLRDAVRNAGYKYIALHQNDIFDENVIKKELSSEYAQGDELFVLQKGLPPRGGQMNQQYVVIKLAPSSSPLVAVSSAGTVLLNLGTNVLIDAIEKLVRQQVKVKFTLPFFGEGAEVIYDTTLERGIYSVQVNPMRAPWLRHTFLPLQSDAGITKPGVPGCLLCKGNMPVKEMGIAIDENYTLVLNPKPYEKNHIVVNANETVIGEHPQQFMDKEAHVRRAVDLILHLAIDEDRPNYNISFNSLGAANTSAHFHLQGFETDKLPLVNTPFIRSRLIRKNGVSVGLIHEDDYPAPVLVVEGTDKEKLIKEVLRISENLNRTYDSVREDIEKADNADRIYQIIQSTFDSNAPVIPYNILFKAVKKDGKNVMRVYFFPRRWETPTLSGDNQLLDTKFGIVEMNGMYISYSREAAQKVTKDIMSESITAVSFLDRQFLQEQILGLALKEMRQLESSSPVTEQGTGFRGQGTDIASDHSTSLRAGERPVTSDKLGGIDMNAIDLDRQGTGVDIQFDPVELQGIIDAGIDGFAPVIINITPLPSILPLLGLEPRKEEYAEELSQLD